jgi:hypothetical protein
LALSNPRGLVFFASARQGAVCGWPGGARLSGAPPPREADGVYGPPRVRFSIAKRITGDEGSAREARQRAYAMTRGLMNGDTGDDRHFQVDFGLVHLGM